MKSIIVFAVILINYGAFCEDPEAVFWRLPRLFHLDDFERCMARRDGLYCLGQFELYSDFENNPLYDLILEKSQDVRLYNRTYLHRGYCLPTRCPGGEANLTARFERCVDAWARGHSLRARIHTLHYCRAHGGPPPAPSTNDTPHTVWLLVVVALLIMNAIGTLYDVMTGKNGHKNEFLMHFSLRANWSKLMAPHEVNDSLRAFRVVNGLKTLLLLGAVIAHVGVISAGTWQYNPRFMEKFLGSPAGGMLGALTTKTQAFIIVSNFFTTYRLLLLSNTMVISYSKIPELFLKRLARIYPVYLLVNGFTATWWNATGDGPMWPVIVGTESQFCREKFWPIAFFLQNRFDAHKICNVQTWVVSVDMQLFIPSLLITIWLMKRRERAIRLLFGFLAGATALTAYVALTGEYVPAFTYMTPENFRTLLFYSRHFTQFFIMPISSVISMVFGIMLGFMCYNLQSHVKPKDEENEEKEKKKPSELLILSNVFALPMVFLWSYMCSLLTPITNPLFLAVMMPIERIVMGVFGLTLIYTSAKVKTIKTNLFGWKGLLVIGRVSMSISMIHWCVNKTLIANRSILHNASPTTLVSLLVKHKNLKHLKDNFVVAFSGSRTNDLFCSGDGAQLEELEGRAFESAGAAELLDTIGVSVISFILSIPMTLMVEYPLTKIMDRFITYLYV